MKMQDRRQALPAQPDKTIIYIVAHAPPPDFSGKFFVPQLRQRGFQALYWDIGPVLGHDMARGSNPADMAYATIARWRELAAKLAKTDRARTIVVPQVTWSPSVFPLYFILRMLRMKTAFFARGYLPFFSEPKGSRHALWKVQAARDKKALRALAKSLLWRTLPRIEKHDIAFVAGRIAERIHGPHARHLVPIHHFDIDRVRAEPETAPAEAGGYHVFLDDYLPHHPDFRLQRAQTVNPATYYASLNAFFRRVEALTGKAIVIAAHPRGEYETNPFEGRTIVAGRSHSLVRHADSVFTHSSTALSFAVLFDRPLCLLHNEEIRSVLPSHYGFMRRTVELLGCSICDLDTVPGSDWCVVPASPERCRQFVLEFLSNAADPRPSSEIVGEGLESLLGPRSVSGHRKASADIP